MSDELTPKIVLFDGVCVLCNYWAQFIIKQDTQKKIKLASVQSPLGQQILTYYGMSTITFDTLVYIEGLELEELQTRHMGTEDLGFGSSSGASLGDERKGKNNNQAFIKTAAIFKILSQLGLPWRLLTIFKIIPASLSDRAYILIARNRYKLFGKNENCILPTPDHQSRYLSEK